jgi:hypothetical protein
VTEAKGNLSTAAKLLEVARPKGQHCTLIEKYEIDLEGSGIE